MLEFDGLTCREIHKLAAKRNIRVGLRAVWNWAADGRFGAAVGYNRQGVAYDRKKVERFLSKKLREDM